MYFAQTVVDAAALGSLYALVALAIGFVFGIMRLVNFAQGDYITVGAYSLIVPGASAAPAPCCANACRRRVTCSNDASTLG